MTVQIQKDGDIIYMFKNLTDQKNQVASAMFIHDDGEYSVYFGKPNEMQKERQRMSESLKFQELTDDRERAYNLCFGYVNQLDKDRSNQVV